MYNILNLRKSALRIYYQFKKSVSTEYFGEFGHELISVIPFAYWLYLKGKLDQTSSTADTKSLYFFSENHIESEIKRNYVIPNSFPVRNIHRRFFNTMMWTPPPYKDVFKNDAVVFDKPICIICNKYNSEWGHPPITFFSKPMLASLFNRLQDHYQIVYCRPTSLEIVDDCSDIYDLEEHDWIRTVYPNVLCVQDLFNNSSFTSFNEFQLHLFANTDHFISVQGGYSILCSYFQGTNIIYGAKSALRTADEINYRTYDRCYHKFSGATIKYAATYDEVITYINDW